MVSTSKAIRLIAAAATGFLVALLFFGQFKDNSLNSQGRRGRGGEGREPSVVKEYGMVTPNFGVNKKGVALRDPLRMLRETAIESNLPGPETIANMPNKHQIVVIHSYLDNADIVCNRKLLMGGLKGGGWEVCDDYAWRPIAPCIVYSFGINYDFSFDDDIARLYGCQVYSFDPSMERQPTYQRSERVMFYRYGLGGHFEKNNTKGWTMNSFSGFREMLGHSDKIIDVVKMDVESYEWETLLSMLREGQLHNVRQLYVEFHLKVLNTEKLQMLADLESAGFRKFYVHKNWHCGRKVVMYPIERTGCYEVHYVNTKFVREMLDGKASSSD